MQRFCMRTTNTLVKLRGCAGRFKYSLDVHVRKYVSRLLLIYCLDTLCTSHLKLRPIVVGGGGGGGGGGAGIARTSSVNKLCLPILQYNVVFMF